MAIRTGHASGPEVSAAGTAGMALPACARGALLLAVLWPGMASAHSFGRIYTLPVPVWMYLYGAAAALVVSFVIVAYFVSVQRAQTEPGRCDLGNADRLFPAPLLMGLRLASLGLLLLTIATGLWGHPNPYANISMTLFWIGFVLAYAYLTALIGNTYAVLSPWVVLCDALERVRPGLFAGQIRRPERWAYWPALLLYMGFIWLELFGETGARSLAQLLLAYTGLNLLGAWWMGRRAWFQYGEFFAVFLRILALMAPFAIERHPDGQRRLVWRAPFIGLLAQPAGQFSLLLFVLFMLSSTAFDGFKATVPFARLYWQQLSVGLLPMLGGDLTTAFPALKALYVWWQGALLLISPWLYLAVYWFFVALSKRLGGSHESVSALACRFAFTLVPIAFVYHLAHYFTLLWAQGGQLLRLASDPFGWGWNLFGTAGRDFSAVPDTGVVWHAQVGLIVAGHIISVYLAHVEALRVFADARRATLSQLPMLLMMVVLTAAGLWILSLPIGGR